MECRFQGQKPVTTRHLEVAYQPVDFRALRERGATWKIFTPGTPQPRGIDTSTRDRREGEAGFQTTTSDLLSWRYRPAHGPLSRSPLREGPMRLGRIGSLVPVGPGRDDYPSENSSRAVIRHGARPYGCHRVPRQSVRGVAGHAWLNSFRVALPTV